MTTEELRNLRYRVVNCFRDVKTAAYLIPEANVLDPDFGQQAIKDYLHSAVDSLDLALDTIDRRLER